MEQAEAIEASPGNKNTRAISRSRLALKTVNFRSSDLIEWDAEPDLDCFNPGVLVVSTTIRFMVVTKANSYTIGRFIPKFDA